MKSKLFMAGLLGVVSLVAVAPAHAQQSQIRSNALQRAEFYNAPRRIQIVDERPFISDHRTVPQAPGLVQLPPPPQGFNGAGGGAGGGYPALASDTPVMQLPAGTGMLPYRTPSNPMGALPKVGFGQWSNIPAGGLGPKVALPGGTSTGVHAQLMPFAKAQPAQNCLKPSPTMLAAKPTSTAPKIASYGADYSGAGGSQSVTAGSLVKTNVRAVMIGRLHK